MIACANKTAESCGIYSFDLIPVTFTSISIIGQFKTDPQILDMPTTLQIDLMPLKEYVFCSEARMNDNEVKINMTTIGEHSSILTFGFYGRAYIDDGRKLGRLEVDYGSESSTTVIAVILVIALLVVAAVVGFILYKRRVKYSAISK